MGNREELLEAAIVCLREHGYGGTRARDLADTAGVSLGAIRYHFGSMESLLNEAVAETSRRWIRGVRASMAQMDMKKGIADSMDTLYDIFARDSTLLSGYAEVFAHTQRSPAARTHLAGIYEEVRQDITKSLPPQNNSVSVASLLLALSDGVMKQWLLDPDRCPDPETLKQAALAIAALCDQEASER